MVLLVITVVSGARVNPDTQASAILDSHHATRDALGKNSEKPSWGGEWTHPRPAVLTDIFAHSSSYAFIFKETFPRLFSLLVKPKIKCKIENGEKKP